MDSVVDRKTRRSDRPLVADATQTQDGRPTAAGAPAPTTETERFHSRQRHSYLLFSTDRPPPLLDNHPSKEVIRRKSRPPASASSSFHLAESWSRFQNIVLDVSLHLSVA
ncbi:hypothetical protein EVAR_93558_1 [Eumeta japonica]|uniref:Uncharacterized protein n=1 Tax=Eumeta variegata TaxID=151549 RepID=A0A4C1UR14_EUMVA|nr:hypothetical protein EVAR_93558_1 [Eumeta japonica]